MNKWTPPKLSKENNMQLNPPAKVRVLVYVAVVLGTALLVPLNAFDVVSDVVLAVWTSVAGAASALAAVNVSKG